MKVNKLLAKAFVLSDLLKYQADAVVSQEIVKKDTGPSLYLLLIRGKV